MATKENYDKQLKNQEVDFFTRGCTFKKLPFVFLCYDSLIYFKIIIRVFKPYKLTLTFTHVRFLKMRVCTISCKQNLVSYFNFTKTFDIS